MSLDIVCIPMAKRTQVL